MALRPPLSRSNDPDRAAVYFSHITTQLQAADVVVVFPGARPRLTAAVQLVKNGFAPRLMVVSTTETALHDILSRNGISGVSALPGGKSRSTFEDVHQIAKTLRDNRLGSVIAVTSDYHLPRALFLLHVYLSISGLEVGIQSFPVGDPPKNFATFRQYGKEAIKFWGSMAELTGNYFTGQLVLDDAHSKKLQESLKKIIL